MGSCSCHVLVNHSSGSFCQLKKNDDSVGTVLRGNNSLPNEPPASALMSTNWNMPFSKHSHRKIMRTIEIKGPVQLSVVRTEPFPDPRTETKLQQSLPTYSDALIPAILSSFLMFVSSA